MLRLNWRRVTWGTVNSYEMTIGYEASTPVGDLVVKMHIRRTRSEKRRRSFSANSYIDTARSWDKEEFKSLRQAQKRLEQHFFEEVLPEVFRQYGHYFEGQNKAA